MTETKKQVRKTYDVVLLPTQAQVLAWRKRAARRRAHLRGCADADDASGAQAASFGTTVATLRAWLADIWELYGDGRALVSPVERSVAMLAAFSSECEGGSAEASVSARGLSRLAARLVEQASGLREFESACENAGRAKTAKGGGGAGCVERREDAERGKTVERGDYGFLSAQERRLLVGVRRYFLLLERNRLIELGCALALLPELVPANKGISVLMEGFPPLTEQQRRFFAKCPQIELCERPAPGAEGARPPAKGVDVRFAFPSGRYARPLLLADAALEALAEDAEPCQAGFPRVVLACKDPKETFSKVAPALSRAGATCSLQAHTRADQTDLGRALGTLHRLANGEEDRAAFVDVLYLPFSGVSASQARFVDARLRGDRLASIDEALAEVCAASEVLSYLEDMAQDAEAGVLAGAVEDALRGMKGVSESYRREQLGALSKVRETMRAASRFRLDMGACLDVLADVAVDASCFLPGGAWRGQARAAGAGVGAGLAEKPAGSAPSAAEPAPANGAPANSATANAAPANGATASSAPDVLVCDWATAAALAPGSCEVLVAADAESANRPVAEREDAGTLLLRKLGVSVPDDALAAARREFCALAAAPARRFIVERCLHDANAEPTYPAMVVEELVDCYRADPSRTDDVDNPYALPPQLQRNMMERGEERLYENFAVEHAEQPLLCRIDRPSMGQITPLHRPLVVLSRSGDDGSVRLSASQLESYLACPYLWFVQRRLRTEALDEDFGPLQMGDFAHHALEGFCKAFQERTGAPKVTPALLPQARNIMAEVLDAEAALQFELKPADNRLVPCTELEVREVAALKQRLIDFLDFEAQLLPTFRPAHFEFEVGVHEKVEYAGVRLVGKVDRIDVDDAGHAVVIDYKGSVSSDYELRSSEGKPPCKVQTLVYAQVAKRLLGLDVVGALYLGYGRTPKLAGAFDGLVLEAAHLPNMKHARCRCGGGEGSFSALLDETEARCARAAESLASGCLEPAPSFPGACRFCPHTACVYREA